MVHLVKFVVILNIALFLVSDLSLFNCLLDMLDGGKEFWLFAEKSSVKFQIDIVDVSDMETLLSLLIFCRKVVTQKCC